MKIGRFLLLTATVSSFGAVAAEPTPNLPPTEVVARVLRANPTVQAAAGQVRVEEANRDRLEAGPYEWNVRFGAHQRRVYPSGGPDERYNEWNAQLERPLRLPGKSSADTELGALGVAIAETGQGDALHETSRALLKYWFVWLKESAAAAQWNEQFALLERQTRAVQRRQQLGDAARLEAVQAEAALAQAEAQLAQARARQTTAGEDLRRRFPGLPLNEPGNIAEPQPIAGSESEWLEAILEHSHELGVARGETRRAQIAAGRAGSDRLPDPTVGVQMARERGGEEHVLGAYIAIPLPGGARHAVASAALAEADVANRREAAATQKTTAEAAALYHSARAALTSWNASRSAAERLSRAADMTARAYQLGEGNLNDLLAARRLANEAQLAARLSQLDALELRYRLLLDAHQLWDLD
jgi:outer membrane protein, heavy metal efflux system